MGILHWLLGSDKNVKTPNLDKAKKFCVDFSGTNLRFCQPENSSYLPSIFPPEKFDLLNINLYEKQKEGPHVKIFTRCSWDFYGKHCCGGITVYQRAYYFDHKGTIHSSCFDKECLYNKIFDYCHRSWGDDNEAKAIGDKGTGLIAYPLKPQDLIIREINGIHWVVFTKAAKGKPPNVHFATPISQYNMLLIDFECAAYDYVDYYSPETNLKEVCEKFIERYMAHVFIELSEAAKQERLSITDPV